MCHVCLFSEQLLDILPPSPRYQWFNFTSEVNQLLVAIKMNRCFLKLPLTRNDDEMTWFKPVFHWAHIERNLSTKNWPIWIGHGFSCCSCFKNFSIGQEAGDIDIPALNSPATPLLSKVSKVGFVWSDVANCRGQLVDENCRTGSSSSLAGSAALVSGRKNYWKLQEQEHLLAWSRL